MPGLQKQKSEGSAMIENMNPWDILALGVVIGELMMGAVIVAVRIYDNKKLYGVYTVPKHIRKYAQGVIRGELEKEKDLQ